MASPAAQSAVNSQPHQRLHLQHRSSISSHSHKAAFAEEGLNMLSQLFTVDIWCSCLPFETRGIRLKSGSRNREPHPSRAGYSLSPFLTMSTNPECQIYVHADGLQNQGHSLENVRQDTKLSHSLITKEVADMTGAKIIELPDVLSVEDEQGTQHNCKTKITLRWRLLSNVAYSREDFHIVQELSGNHDALLRNTIILRVPKPGHPAYPTELQKQKHDDKETSRLAKKAADEQKKKDRDERLKPLQPPRQNGGGAGQAGSGTGR